MNVPILNLQELAHASTVASAAIALAGLLAIWWQLKKQKEIAAASFLVEFNSSFETHRALYGKLAMCDGEESPLQDGDIPDIVNYLTFFETLHSLVQRRVLSLETVDDLFGYRFFIAVHNAFVQEKELIKDAEAYRHVYQLHRKWSEHRRGLGKPIPRDRAGLQHVPNYSPLSQ